MQAVEFRITAGEVNDVNGLTGRRRFDSHVRGIGGHQNRVGEREQAHVGIVAGTAPYECAATIERGVDDPRLGFAGAARCCDEETVAARREILQLCAEALCFDIFEAVRHLRSQGITILYTTHYLEEAEDLCDRIAIMDEGRVVALGTLAELLAHAATNEVVELRLAAPTERLATLQALPQAKKVEQSGALVRIYTRRAEAVLAGICEKGILEQPIVQIGVTPVSLQSVFIELTGKDLRD